MNFIEKTYINIQRLVNPEFNNFWKEQQNFNKSYAGSNNTLLDPSTQPIDLGDYGLSQTQLNSKGNKSKKNIEERRFFLTYEQMWDFYTANSLIRACVDTKVKQISSLEWKVLPKNVHYLKVKTMSLKDRKEREYLEQLLYNPNSYDESFQTLISKVLTDLLIFDAGVFQKIFNSEGKEIGLKALHGPDIKYITNKYREPIGFLNSKTGEVYTEEEIIYLKYHSRTNSFYGLPAIESILPEITGDIYAILYNNRYFSENEIPDGILYLGDIDQVNYDRVKASFRAYKAKHYALRMLASKTEPKWINFKATNKDMQFAEMQDRLRKRIMTVFQINDNELGYTENMNKSSGEMQNKIFANKGLKPLIKLLEYHINTEFIQKINPNYYFTFDIREQLKEEEEYRQIVVQTDLMKLQLFNLASIEGRITLNEYRNLANSLVTINEVLDLNTYEWGDVNVVSSSYNSLESSLKNSENNQKAIKDKGQELKDKVKSISLQDFENKIELLSSKDESKKANEEDIVFENAIASLNPIVNNRNKDNLQNNSINLPSVNNNIVKKNKFDVSFPNKKEQEIENKMPKMPALPNPSSAKETQKIKIKREKNK